MSRSTSNNIAKSLPGAVAGIVVAILVGGVSTVLSGKFAPFLFLLCVGGMVVVAILESRKERIEKEGRRRVNYRKLAAIDIDKLLPWLKENVRGHDEVIEAIFQHLKRSVQLARPGRTLGNFLLVGPTGTGKTHLAQRAGDGLFPQSEVVLLNMNEYRQPGAAFGLLGPPPGMPGSDVGGRLTRPVLENPYRVIVLDELEKAHRDVHDCLYEILDTGTCRDKSSGELVDFSGSVFFATSAAGVEKLRELSAELGGLTSPAWLGRSRDVLAEAAKFDRAFLSRWDGIYLLDRLSPVHVAEVACLQLCRYWQEYGIEVGYVAPELIFQIVQRNQEFAEYGVRQLGRIIREMTEAAVLDAKRRGATKVNLNAGQGGHLEIEVPHVDGQTGGMKVEVPR
jgi:ATP-dependent Clp protease ATP-binding subunit ClpA